MRAAAATSLLSAMLLLPGCVGNGGVEAAVPDPPDLEPLCAQAAALLDYVDGTGETFPGLTHDEASWLDKTIDLFTSDDAEDAAAALTEVADSLRERHEAVNALKETACLGEDNRGYLALRHGEALEDAEAKNEAQRLLAAENKDRKQLYKEVTRFHDHPGLTVSAVEQIYAGERLLRAPAGAEVQLPPEGPEFDAFKDSPRGRALSGLCQPDAWVAVR